jgi:hypothetical protein
MPCVVAESEWGRPWDLAARDPAAAGAAFGGATGTASWAWVCDRSRWGGGCGSLGLLLLLALWLRLGGLCGSEYGAAG